VFGYAPLRRAVADYLRVTRGVICEPEQIAMVAGVQEALDLVARLILNPGDRVWIENPGYIGATIAFEAAGATIAPLDVDAEGMVVPPRRAPPARLAYVTPAHQFPLGVAMSLPRRLALIEWARRTRALIFEDDYDSEYRYAGASLPALQGLDRHGVVIFAGTFSKTLFPSMRLGYLVVPPHFVEPLTAMKSVTNRFAPVLEQAVLCDFMTEGHFGRHVRRMRQIYAGRLHALLEASGRRLAGLLDIAQVEAGLQTTAWLRGGRSANAVTRAAAERGVEVTPLTRYCRQTIEREGLVLGFAAVDEREIERGVVELASVLGKVCLKADTTG
jgi:GntR family transcriptional regulator / MocR family aminotransferase